MVRVITYGTFDTFHYGHLELLKKARELGDYLIVGLSTDEFNELKGKKSMFNYEKRKEWLSLLNCVDEVIPEDSWEQKYQDVNNLNINIFVMGSDWEGKFNDLDTKVQYINRTKDVSSTQIKKLLKNKQC